MAQPQHQPLFENPKQGKLRTKVENGECNHFLHDGVASVFSSEPSGAPELPYPLSVLLWDLKHSGIKGGTWKIFRESLPSSACYTATLVKFAAEV